MKILNLWQKLKSWYSRIPLMLVDAYIEDLTDQAVDAVIWFKQGLDNEQVTLTKPFRSYGLEAPEGFEYNGASSPRFAWWVIPRMYKMLKASARHDYACFLAKNYKERLLADVVFFLMAYYTERLALWRCICGLIGVRIGAFFGVGKNY